MDIQIYNRDLELTDRLRDYVDAKVERFTRYLPNIESARVDLSETNARDTTRRMVAQVTIRVPGSILRAEERSGDIFAAFDAVLDKMDRQIERYKGRRKNRRMSTPSIEEVLLEEAPEESLGGRIVRVKRFDLNSILPEEAIEQMELLGHFFYIFLDGTDGRLSVVYKREDGDYGLLKPVY